MTSPPPADAAGVQKAPRHEIAVGSAPAVPQALRGLSPKEQPASDPRAGVRRGDSDPDKLERLAAATRPISTASSNDAHHAAATQGAAMCCRQG